MAKGSVVRLRQLVLVAPTLEPLVTQLRSVLDLGEGYQDPGVGAFGLENMVLPIGDQFLEVVAPLDEGTTAGRYLERRGAGGYMIILQFPDVEAARRRALELGMRVVWEKDLEEISGTHLHPKDTGGAILSLDEARPPTSWFWAGPWWQEQVRTKRVGGLAGAVIQSATPKELAQRWAAITGTNCEAMDGRGWCIDCGADASLRFVASRDGRGEGLCEMSLYSTDTGAVLEAAREAGLSVENGSFDLGGVRFSLQTRESAPAAALSSEVAQPPEVGRRGAASSQ